MESDPWIEQTLASLRGLRGARIVAWKHIPEAIDPDGVISTAVRLPIKAQSVLVEARIDAGPNVRFETYQDTDAFGLTARAYESSVSNGKSESLPLPLPLGIVEAVIAIAEEDLLWGVRLNVNGTSVGLFAGEVEPSPGGSVEYVRMDESILTLVEPGATFSMPWRNPPVSQTEFNL